jgi:hypothetical protein
MYNKTDSSNNKKVGREAAKQKRSRSEYVELHFESFFKQPEQESTIE